MLKKALFLLCSGKTEKVFYGRYKVIVGEYTSAGDGYKIIDGVRYDQVSRTYRGYMVRVLREGLIEIGAYELIEGEDLFDTNLNGEIIDYGDLIEDQYDSKVSVNPSICGKTILVVNETTGKKFVMNGAISGSTGELIGDYSDYEAECELFDGIETGQDCTVAVYYYKKG